MSREGRAPPNQRMIVSLPFPLTIVPITDDIILVGPTFSQICRTRRKRTTTTTEEEEEEVRRPQLDTIDYIQCQALFVMIPEMKRTFC